METVATNARGVEYIRNTHLIIYLYCSRLRHSNIKILIKQYSHNIKVFVSFLLLFIFHYNF